MRLFRRGTNVNDETEIKPEDVTSGPPVENLTGPGAQGAGDGDGAGAGDPEPITHHRVRIEHADGSRSWHVEETDDPETALRLARGRSMGTVIRAEPLNADGSPRKAEDD